MIEFNVELLDAQGVKIAGPVKASFRTGSGGGGEKVNDTTISLGPLEKRAAYAAGVQLKDDQGYVWYRFKLTRAVLLTGNDVLSFRPHDLRITIITDMSKWG